MRATTRKRMRVPAVLLLLTACAGEEPAVQNGETDRGGMYEDGALEQVQPVEPEVLPDTGTTTAPEP